MKYNPVTYARFTADATVKNDKGNVSGIIITTDGGASRTVRLRNGGLTGTILWQFTPPVSVMRSVKFPGEILFNTNIFLDIDANVTEVGVFYQ